LRSIRSIVRIIDAISEYSGRWISWICLTLVVMLCYEVVSRYVFDEPTMWAHALASMFFCVIVSMGWAYVHKHKGHVRIDVIYARLSPRGKAIVDTVCALLLLFPVLGVLIYACFKWMLASWLTHEVYIETYWYPPMAPVKTAMFIGVCLFALQSIAEFTRDVYMLVRSKSYD